MEKFGLPHLDKTVGVPTEHAAVQQPNFEAFLAKKYKEGGEKLRGDELEKTRKDMQLIDYAQSAVDDYLKKYSRTKEVTVPFDHIHLFKEGSVAQLTGIKNNRGFASIVHGDIAVDRSKRDVDFSMVLFHELMHAKSFSAIQVIPGDMQTQRKIETYRAGFSITSRDGKKIYFDDVNEAIVSFLTRRFFKEYIQNNEAFEAELKEIQEKNIALNFSREKEFQDGSEYIQRIYELRKDTYSLEQITRIFVEAGLNGNLLKVARLVEETFGKGSFRKLGEITGRKLE